EFADHPVILMRVDPAGREYQIRLEVTGPFFQRMLDLVPRAGKPSVGEVENLHRTVGYESRQRVLSFESTLGSTGATHGVDGGRLPRGEFQKRTATSQFDIVGMRAQAEHVESSVG